MAETVTNIYAIFVSVDLILLVIIMALLMSREKPVLDILFAWIFIFTGVFFAVGAVLVAIDGESAATISSGVILAGLMGLVGVLAGIIRGLLWRSRGKVRRSDAMALRHVDLPVLFCMIGLLAFAIVAEYLGWSVEDGSVVTSVLVSASLVPPLLQWPQYVPKLFGRPTRAGGTATQQQEPERASVTLELVAQITNCGNPHGHVCEAVIRAAPDDDRVI